MSSLSPETSDQASGLLNKIGIQLFSLPKMLENDFVGSIELLSEMGYTEVELFGPYPFSHQTSQESWKAMAPMLGFSGSGYFGKDIKEVKSILDNHGLSSPCAHTDMETLLEHMGHLAEAAHILGHEYVCLPAIPDERRQSLDDYYRLADLFNQIGENAKKAGIKFAYHNHGYGLQETEDLIPLNIILDNTDPELVFLEMDIFWTTAGGIDPITLLEKYPDRYHLLHLKDMKEQKRFSGDGSDAAQWIALFPFMTTIGEGVLGVKEIIEKALSTGVKHFLVEQDMVAEPEIALKKSFTYLNSL